MKYTTADALLSDMLKFIDRPSQVNYDSLTAAMETYMKKSETLTLSEFNELRQRTIKLALK